MEFLTVLLDILVIGKGDWDSKVDSSIIRFLRSKKINVEILPTEQACSTFNFLNSERRVVAAALIPPKVISDLGDLISTRAVEEMDFLGENEEAGDFRYPEVEKLMKSFKEKGITDTVAKYTRDRKKLIEAEAEERKTQDIDNPPKDR